MRRTISVLLSAAFVVVTSTLCATPQVLAEDVSNSAANITPLVTALDNLDRWLGEGTNGDNWRKFLATSALRKQIDKGKDADPAVVALVLDKYRADENGLDKAKFVVVRQGLQNWLSALKQQYTGNLPKMAWAARGDYQAMSRSQRLEPARNSLRTRALQLEQTLGSESQFAQNWKRFLKWELLEPHLTGDPEINSQSVEDLRLVLRRFRSNHPGLENPVFTSTADALEPYRGLLQWYDLVGQYAKSTRQKYSAAELERRLYILQLLELEKQLERHEQAPTVETTRRISEILALVEDLQQSPQLVRSMKSSFSSPNMMTEISERSINKVAQQPVSETTPVRDFILGARIRGTANSTALVTFQTLPANDHIALEVRLAGNIQSNTLGHRKPVLINSLGSTDFVAIKRLEISDDRFVALPAQVSARTNTKTCSVNKTGGRFGKRFVERIAWKRVRQSKTQGESIAARRAEKKVAARFDSQIQQTIHQARNNYDDKVRSQLVRIGMFPEYHRMASTPDKVNIAATLASYSQVSTGKEPPEITEGDDLTVRIHETAVNNYLPTLLAGAVLRQEKESEPPKLEGDVPAWLRKLARQHGGQRKLTVKDGEVVESTDAENAAESSSFEFKPYFIRLNRSHPASVSFDDQQLTIRVRIAELITIEEGEETVREDWDFIITYEIVKNNDGVVLRRAGEVEPFPTGFDPRWGDKLTNEQVATRGALSKVIENRAASDEGLPTEISLPEVKIPNRSGVETPLVLSQLTSDDGWLILGYKFP